MAHKVTLIPGDGSGPEVVAAAKRVVEATGVAIEWDEMEAGAAMIEKYRDKIINIHPSLIPSFCGVGFYGLKVHEAALRRGVKITGATVHFVDEGMDSGPIILQKAVEVEKGDTPEVLQRRVMEQAEWKILPKAIDMIANGEI